MSKTIISQINPLSLALREITKATLVPSQLLAYLSKMVYFMHAVRAGDEGADEDEGGSAAMKGLAGNNTSSIYAALLLIENLVPAWYALDGGDPDERMLTALADVLDGFGIDGWRQMIDQFRVALSVDISQGHSAILSYRIVEFYTAFVLTIPYCESYLTQRNGLRKAA